MRPVRVMLFSRTYLGQESNVPAIGVCCPGRLYLRQTMRSSGIFAYGKPYAMVCSFPVSSRLNSTSPPPGGRWLI